MSMPDAEKYQTGDPPSPHGHDDEIGISSDTHIEIFSGVEEGETVVIGSYRVLSKDLRHDAKVKVDKKSRRFQSESK